MWEPLIRAYDRYQEYCYADEDPGIIRVKWQIKADYEICVIKKDNEHGHISWGWGGPDKIILWSNGIGANNLHSNTDEKYEKEVEERLAWATQVAIDIANMMNEKGL